jgi:hypothetical protein
MDTRFQSKDVFHLQHNIFCNESSFIRNDVNIYSTIYIYIFDFVIPLVYKKKLYKLSFI